MAVRRQSLEKQILDPSVSAEARQQYEEESDRIDKALSPVVPSPLEGVPVEVFEDAWMRRFGIFWLCVAFVTLRKAWKRRHEIARLLHRLSVMPNTGALSQSPLVDDANASNDMPLASETTAASPTSAIAEAEAVFQSESPAESRDPSSVGVTSLTPTERHGQDPKSVAANRAMEEIVIPSHHSSRMEATVVDGQPGVRFDRDSTLFYPLTSPLRRAKFSILAATDRPLRMKEINDLLPHRLKRTYESGIPIWHEGAERIPSKIYVHTIVRQTFEGGPWVLDLDALPSRAASVEPPDTA